MSTLLDPPAEAAPAQPAEDFDPPAPLQRFLRIEADQFCPCAYNLHGQNVTYDQRLGIPVVRCPECGRWSAAGHGSSAGKPWLTRLGAILLLWWCVLVLAIVVASLAAVFGLTLGRTIGDTVLIAVLEEDGRQVEQLYDTTGAYILRTVEDQVAVDRNDARLKVRHVPSGHPMAEHPFSQWSNGIGKVERITLRTIALAVGFFLGAFLAVALWHLRAWKRWALLALMILPAGAAASILMLDETFELMRAEAWQQIAGMVGGAALAMAAGLFAGRPIARWLVTMLVPPRPRQALAFLWHADGKPMPSMID